MASCRLVQLATLLCFAAVASAQAPAAAGGRPTLDEWKGTQAEEDAGVKAKAAKQSKMSAVDKVISMLEDLQTQVMDEGEEEAKSYNKFACFCKDTSAEKTEAIERGQDDQRDLTTTIAELATKRDELDAQIDALLKEIKQAETEMKVAEAERAKALAEYEKNEADLSAAIEALEGAITVLKASTNPSLLQLQSVSKTVRKAALIADAMGLGDSTAQRALALFLQQTPEVPMQDYDFHSDGIIETLEKLLKDFTNEKQAVDEAEVKSVSAFDRFMQDKTDFLKRKNAELEDTKKQKADTQEEIASTNQQLTVVSATLLDDQQYLTELSSMCTLKAKTWDQRTQVRQDELSALTAAIGIIKSAVSEKTTAATIRFAQQGVSVRLADAVAGNEGVMDVVEAEAEAADGEAESLAFIQVAKARASLLLFAKSRALHEKPQRAEQGKQVIVELLRSKGSQLKSTLLTALATQISADPFAKVKQLIQELIERLLQEAGNEANQKGWCDKATSDAEQKREYSAKAIEELNGQMAKLEATRDKLAQALEVLAEEIVGLEEARAQAEKMRADEKAENANTVKEAQEGLSAVEQAIDILSKFYKTAAKSKVELVQGPADDAPDTGFEGGEAYQGAQGTATGIIGMLDVIKSDFERTISETEKAEAQAEQDFLAFMTETGKSLAEKKVAEEQKTKLKDDAEEKLASSEEDLQSQTALLQKGIEELLELKPVCIDTGMSYQERDAFRQEELEALKKALCILQNFAEYGPEAAADRC